MQPLPAESDFTRNLNSIRPSPSARNKFRFTIPKIRIIRHLSRARRRGVSRSSRHVGRGIAMDARSRWRMRRSRTVKSCGSDAADTGVKPAGSILPATVTTSSPRREDHEVSRKPIAQGLPECSPLHLYVRVQLLLLAQLPHTKPRVQRAPGTPAPSLRRGAIGLQSSDANRVARTSPLVIPGRA